MTGIVILGVAYVRDNLFAEILTCVNKAAIGTLRAVVVNHNLRTV